MSDENFIKDEVVVDIPEEHYFSRSKNQWLMAMYFDDVYETNTSGGSKPVGWEKIVKK